MGEPIRAAVYAAPGTAPTIAEAAVPASGQISRDGPVRELEADASIEHGPVDVLVVACATAPEAVALLERLRSKRPMLPLVAVCETAPEGALDALFEAGAADVIVLPEAPDRVAFTLVKVVARHRGYRPAVPVEPGAQAPMICVLGPKGGTGKTVVSSNLASVLARKGMRPAVVDLDLQFGDIGLALALTPERTSYDLAMSGGDIDAEKLRAYLTLHPSGAEVLLAPVRPDQASAVTTDLMEEVYALLRRSHDVVIVDTPPDFTPEVIGAIDAASHYCLVGMLDSLSTKNTKLGLETLELMDCDATAVTLVLNRADSDVGITGADVAEVIGREPDVLIPSDRAVPRSINSGQPIALGDPASPVAAAIEQLAWRYLPSAANLNGNRGNGNGHGIAGRSRRLLPLFRRSAV